MAQKYTAIIWSTVTYKFTVRGAEADSPEEAKAVVEQRLNPSFAQVKKVVTDERYAQVQARNRGKHLADYYHQL